MKERTTASIAIKRGIDTVQVVPITEACTRKYALMSEDYVVLSFELSSAVHFAIGDYIDDEIFGRFVITKEQMPTYNVSTGGYTYSLQFDAEYMAWNNRVLMLTMTIDGFRVRKEASWYLTDNLAAQVNEVLYNVECLGYEGYSVSIDYTTAKNAKEVKLMTYSGMKIIDALNAIADEWECEWWVSSDKVLHFGKCEIDETVTFENGVNVESMSIQDNRNEYANKIFVYGSQKNMPTTYRKSLNLTITGKRLEDDGYYYYDTDKKLTADMFPIAETTNAVIHRDSFVYELGANNNLIFTGVTGAGVVGATGYYEVSAESIPIEATTVKVESSSLGAIVDYRVSAKLLVTTGNATHILSYSEINGTSRTGADHVVSIPGITIPTTSKSVILYEGECNVEIRYEVTLSLLPISCDGIRCNPSTPIFLYVKKEELNSKIIKVHGYSREERTESLSWSNWVYLYGKKTKQVEEVVKHKISYNIELEQGCTYSIKLAADANVSVITFVKVTGTGPTARSTAVGWIKSKSTSKTQYNFSAEEHGDATHFVLCTYADAIEPLTTYGAKTDWGPKNMRIGGVEKYSSPQSTVVNPNFYALWFCDDDGEKIADPVTISVGDEIVIDDESTTILVPSAYYTSEYDNPSSLSRIGEVRLQLPIETNGYVMANDATEDNAVEDTVVFEDIYPRCDLLVESLDEEQKTYKQQYEGEEKTSDWQWTQYAMTLKVKGGGKFPFKSNYILSGANLQVKFLTPSDVGWNNYSGNGCKLAGMTFDVAFDIDGTYTIVRNEDYGAMLPNEVLRPNVGDPCVLIGWNPRAIESLGLVSAAEERLQAKANEYKAAIEDGQFTFDCSMMSDFAFDQFSDLKLYESQNKALKEENELYLYVKNGYSVYKIPVEGTRVNIVHGALSKTKTSRIIGYEFKLDKPYDSPRYVVGETDAYSKLAKIEREIKKLNG